MCTGFIHIMLYLLFRASHIVPIVGEGSSINNCLINVYIGDEVYLYGKLKINFLMKVHSYHGS